MPNSEDWKTRHACYRGHLKGIGEEIKAWSSCFLKNLHSVNDRC